MSAVGSASSSDQPRLSQLFDDVWKVWEYVENTEDPTVSETFQDRVREGTEAAEKAISMVNQLSLFSENEELEEVLTNEIKYMLLPALLGYLEMKKTKIDRLATLKQSEIFYIDFLHMCKNYGVTQVDIPLLSDTDNADSTNAKCSGLSIKPPPRELNALNVKRQQKIARYKEKKEMETHLKELEAHFKKEYVDEEIKRDYYITLLKRWINVSLEELESIQEEKTILEEMSKMRGANVPKTEPAAKQTPAFRPFILTKNILQKKVFGAGYPSLPTYTVEEYYDRQVALGRMPAPGTTMPTNKPMDEDEAEAREVEKEKLEDDDDEEMLQKARSWDDWKDDHRRGWGNTQNKG